MSQPPSPASPYAPGTARITPSGRWYALAAVVLVAGILGAVALVVIGLLRMSNEVDGFQRVPVPGSSEVQLTETGGHTVYFEYSGASADYFDGEVNIRITGPDGTPVSLQDYSSSVTYDFSGHEGRAGFSFDAPRTGTYHVVTQGDSRATAAIGRGLGSSLVTMILAAAGVGAAGVIIGLVMLIVVAVKRGSSKRRLAAATGWGGRPGYPGGPPPGPHEF